MTGPRRLIAHLEAVAFEGDAGEMLARARDVPGVALLDTGGGTDPERVSILAVGLEAVVRWPGAGDQDPFDAVREHLARFQLEPDPAWPFLGGLVGWFGYECRGLLEDLPQRHPPDGGLPDVFLAASRVCALRHERSGRTVVASLAESGDEAQSARSRRLAGELKRRLEAPAAPSPPPSRSPFTAADIVWPDGAAHLDRVRRALRHIFAGDVYQVNVAQRWTAPRPPDLAGLYRRLRAVNPPAHGGFMATGGEAVLSVSPETFLEVDGRRVVTRPIKGTRPRDPDPDRDAALAAQLRSSEKDRAELAMIVDILRNDLSRVCAPGSVAVPVPLIVESHPTVHHLVAEVAGVLEEGRDRVDLLRATLPGGSVTGAPRIRAMEIIDELESCRRGPYCGALGTLGYDGRMHLNVLIRTVFTAGARLLFHGGGGIVADSDPEAERAETVHKVRGIVRALAGDEAAAS